MIAVTRRYHFPAAHVLVRPELGEEENECLYGKCAKYHGHDYAIDVTVTGPVDPHTGWIVPPEQLDALVQERIVARLGHRNLNEDPWFREQLPTAENVVRRVASELADAIEADGDRRLVRVRLSETRKNTFECGGRS